MWHVPGAYPDRRLRECDPLPTRRTISARGLRALESSAKSRPPRSLPSSLGFPSGGPPAQARGYALVRNASLVVSSAALYTPGRGHRAVDCGGNDPHGSVTIGAA
jgi:hypothetical protein